MYATVYGRDVMLSAEESERIVNKLTERLLQTVGATRTYIESLDKHRQESPDQPKPHGWWSGLDSNITSMLEELATFYAMNGQQPPKPLARSQNESYDTP